MKRALAISAIALVGLGLPGYAISQGMVFDAAPAEDDKAEAQSIAAAADPAQVLAVVNGKNITRAEIDAFVEQLPPQARQLPLEVIYQPLIKQMVTNQLVLTEANKAGIAEKPEVQKQIEMRAQQIVFESFIEDRVNAALTQDILRAEYDKTIAEMSQPEDEVRARHILVKTEEEARKVLSDVAEGKDFAELAAKYSIGPTKTSGGDLGYFTRDTMVKPFADAAFDTIPVGKVGMEPVETQFGWHVIKVEDRREKEVDPKTLPTYEAMEDQLKQRLGGQFVDQYLAELHDKAEVKIYNLDGTEQKAEESAE